MERPPSASGTCTVSIAEIASSPTPCARSTSTFASTTDAEGGPRHSQVVRYSSTVLERGLFPFGRPNASRPMRLPRGRPAALVVGVYPSAFHVAWSPPNEFDVRDAHKRNRPLIASLAVDVEPTVFWDGVDPSPSDLLGRWRGCGLRSRPSRFRRPGHNGPSGSGLLDEILTPLGLDPATLAFTDAVPWFFVKHGANSQGEAIANRFTPVADRMGVERGSLPRRPSTRALVELASSSARRDSLRAELLSSEADLLLTLGDEARGAVLGIADDTRGLPQRIVRDGYGQIGTIQLNGKTMEVMPLAHPGFIRQRGDQRWTDTLEAWKASCRL